MYRKLYFCKYKYNWEIFLLVDSYTVGASICFVMNLAVAGKTMKGLPMWIPFKI